MNIQSKIKVLIFVSIFILGNIAHSASAVTVSSSQVITDYKTLTIGVGFYVPNWTSGNLCNTSKVSSYGFPIYFCPSGLKQYAQNVVVDGAIVSNVWLPCTIGTTFLLSACSNWVYKTTVSSCTYTSSVASWGACNESGVQYATGYNYTTVAGTNCIDQAPSSQACTPPYIPVASCSISFSPNPLSTGSTGSVTIGVANDADGVAVCNCSGLEIGIANLTSGTYPQGPFSSAGTKSCTCTVANAGGSKTCSGSLTVSAPTTYSCPSLPVPHTAYYSGDTTSLIGPTSATYSSSNTTAKCQYYCLSGYTWNGSSCVAITYSCPSLPVPHTAYYSGDTTSLIGPTGATYSSSNTTAKCEYSCGSDYIWNGSSCVVIPELTVTLTTNPSVTAGVGELVRWYATPAGGVPPYDPYEWSGDVSSTTINNWIDVRIGTPGAVSIQVEVQDSVEQYATDSATIDIVENQNPQ